MIFTGVLAMSLTNSRHDYIVCPYCGNMIPLRRVRRRVGFPKYFIIELEFVKEWVDYHIKCPFCKREYVLFPLTDYGVLTRIMRFNRQTLEWLRKYDVDPENLFWEIIGVVEPLGPVYRRFLSRLKRRTKIIENIEYTTKGFIEVVFKHRFGETEARGVLAGRYMESNDNRRMISIEQSYWLDPPNMYHGDIG